MEKKLLGAEQKLQGETKKNKKDNHTKTHKLAKKNSPGEGQSSMSSCEVKRRIQETRGFAKLARFLFCPLLPLGMISCLSNIKISGLQTMY